jgi:hypothetical protein
MQLGTLPMQDGTRLIYALDKMRGTIETMELQRLHERLDRIENPGLRPIESNEDAAMS